MAMASRVLLMALALVSMLFAQQASSQSSSGGCTTAIVSLSPCLGYITGNSSTPSSTCCSSLASVVSTQAQCLCTLLSGGASQLGLTINQTKALALPGACNVKTSPLSQCNAAAPTEAPAATPSGPSVPTTPSTPSTPAASAPTKPSTPSVPTTPAGKGSNTVPSTTGESSDGTSSYRSMTFSAVLFFTVCIYSFVL